MRSYLESAARSERAGDRSQQAICMWAVAAALARSGRLEAAAIVVGWTRSVLGAFRGFGLAQPLNESVDSLPELLPAARYSELTARGAAMDHDEILHFARSEVDYLLTAQE